MLKKFIKENYIFIIIMIFLCLGTFIKLPYRLKKTGGLININDRIKLDGYDINGSYNMAYVSELDVNPFIYIVSLINKDWDIEKIEENNISNSDLAFQGRVMLNYSNNVAYIVASTLANKEIKIKDYKNYVIYIDEKSKTDLKVGDEILKINNIDVKKTEINDITNKYKIGDNITIDVINNNKKYKREAKIINYDGEKKLGIMVIPNYEIESDIEFNFTNNEYGSSGGLMMTLSLYDKLTEYDLAKGRTIAGTGTINIDGTVGEISGIKYKIKGAVKEKADVFLVAEANYEEAIKIKEKYNYDIEIVKISNIKEAIEYLKK